MSRSIISQEREDTNHESDFDPTLTVSARFTGGAVTLAPEHVDWIGETLGRVDVPGGSPMMLRTYEMRDLAIALLNLAAHIDEEKPREIRRSTEAGEPEFNGIGGGL